MKSQKCKIGNEESKMPDPVRVQVKDTVEIEKFNPNQISLKRWLQHLNGALKIMGISGEARVPYLLYHLGTKYMGKLCDYMDDKELLLEKYDDLEKNLKELFDDKKSEIAEVYKFGTRRQIPGESVKAYITEFKCLS